ncbi:MAG: hypothetical protein JXA73_06375 [Acidobacteria bacterium]|nr:hypothetical protein [Acidobacteriota bacterium]
MNEADARYLIVGAYAVIYYTEPRYTKDLDIWADPTPENARRIWDALMRFGAPLADLTLADLSNPDIVFQIGIEPNRVDILLDVKGLNFQEAWERRASGTYEDQKIHVLSYEDVVHSKKASGREQDILDAYRLEAIKKKKS